MTASRRRASAAVLLMTTHYHPVVGGVETHARDVARGLRERGRRVAVLTTRVDGHDGGRVARVDGVPVVRTRPAMSRRHVSKWLFLPIALVAAIRLSRHYDVIFCPDIRAIGIAAIAAGWWTGRPVVLQGATPGAFSMAHWDEAARAMRVPGPSAVFSLAKRVVATIHRRAAAVTCITRTHVEEARAAGIDADRIHYVPHGVDTARFLPPTAGERDALRRRLGWPSGQIVLFLGRLSREKGVIDLLHAWRIVAAGHPDARLILVGPDEPGHHLDAGAEARSLVQQPALASATIAGPTTDAPSVLRAADVLVQPSHYEAFPLTVIEALSSGVPVVAALVGGLRDYLVDGENALTVPPSNIPALATAIGRMLAGGDLRERLGRVGRQTVVDRFDRQRNLDRYAAIFDEVSRAGQRRMKPTS